MTSTPARLAGGLTSRGGFDVFQGIIDPLLRSLLLREAEAQFPASVRTDILASDDEEVRGGSPARSFWSAGGGIVQTALYTAPWFLKMVGEIAGDSVEATGQRATYTYYARAGDHLAVHRDVEDCDVAVISCLYDDAGPRTHGGRLCLYPGRTNEGLSALRSTPLRGAVRVRLMPGEAIVLFGGRVPHQVLPVESGYSRIVSVMCFRATEHEDWNA